MKYFFLIILASIISSCGLDKADTTDVRVPPSDAPSNMGSEYVTMIRNVSCGDWIKEIDEKDPSDSVQSWPMLTNEAWLLGYMSGLSAGKGVNVLQNTDAHSMKLFVTNHCREKPLEKISDAANLIFESLVLKTNINR